jgi:tight adherence protein B
MAAVFVLVFSAWTICVLLWVVQYARRRKRFQKRLGLAAAEARRSQTLQLWQEDYRTRRGTVKRRKQTLGERLEVLRRNAGWRTPAHLVLLAVAGVAAMAGIGTVVLGYDIWLGLGAALAVAVVFNILTKQRINQRTNLFETQFVDGLRIAARALRAGHPLIGAFQAISDEIGEPIGPIFGDICQEQALGLDLRESIQKVAEATHDTDLRLFATSVSIQMTTGGNLADLMERLADVMRSRMRLKRRVRVLTAATKLSKNTLLATPVILFLLLNVAAPDFVGIMYVDPVGKMLMVGTVLSMLFGAWVMGKMSQIKY